MTPSQQPLTPKVTAVVEEQGTGPDGKAAPIIRVQYMIGNHGPFIERVPKASFDQSAVSATMNAMAQKIASLPQ